MCDQDPLSHPEIFSAILFEKMKRINPGIAALELYEFRYALDNLYPLSGGWAAVVLEKKEDIEKQIGSSSFYSRIKLKPRAGDRIVLDEAIVRLARMLFTGLVTGEYPEEWIRQYFYFDIRGFIFLTRTFYFTPQILAHLGGRPLAQFEPKQKQLERCQSIGYQEFKAANADLDQLFIDSVQRLIDCHGIPILMAIAGPTAAGKTEIVARLHSALEQSGRKTTSIEMDNFLTDRDYREERGIDSIGKQATHFELFKRSLTGLLGGQRVAIPRYDFVFATSSHDLEGKLKPGCTPIEIEPADIIFVEGNFPFLLDEVAPLIGIKVVYLTDDEIRLKRKWKRDIDYRKKYEPTYFRNRFFKDQFLMAEKCYRPQMEKCDLLVDTTGGALWATPEMEQMLATI